MKSKNVLESQDVAKVLKACEEAAAARGLNVAIAITDDAGYLLALRRMDGVNGVSAEVAHLKAKCSALTGRPSKAIEDRARDRVAFINFPAGLPIEGGVPLMFGTDRLGAVGVSGAQSEDDAAIASAGATSLS